MESSERPLAKALGMIFLGVLITLLVVKVLRQGIYSSRLGMNIAIVGKEEVGLLMIRPEEDIVGWVTFPKNLVVKIFNSEAKYPVVSLWNYGVLEKNPYEVVEKSLGLSVGVVIARVIKVEGNISVVDVLANIHKWNFKTDLSIRDRFLVRKFLADSLASKKVLEMDIPQKIFDETIEPDGKEVLTFNSVATLWTKNKFVLESILSENADLMVNNLSGQVGLGTQVARQLEAAGMRVVEVKSDPLTSIDGKGCFFRSQGSFPYTEELLLNQMNCWPVKAKAPESQQKGIAVWILK